MNFNIESRISKYIAKIDAIRPSNRNNALHKLAIRLRAIFGLIGDALVAVLLEVNQSKCTEPLSESEIRAICRSVDKSNAPIGDPDTAYTGHQFQQTPNQKQRVAHVVSVGADPIPVETLLQKEVSFYQNFWVKTPSGTTTFGQFLADFKHGAYKAQIEAIRAEPDKNKRDELKKRLPCITPHANPAEGKTKEASEKAGRNGVINVDYDDIPEGEMESAMAKVFELPHVLAVAMSASGSGFSSFSAYEGTPGWEILLTALQADFPDYKIDMNSKGIYRLRFASHDPNLLIKSGEVFPIILTEQMEPSDDADEIESLPRVLFPVDCLPPILANMAKGTQCGINLKDPAMPAVSVLAVVASVIGSSCRIEIMPGYTEPAALNVVSVADTGSAKSGSIRAATRHLKALQADNIKQWKREDHEWKQKHSEWRNASKKDRGVEPKPPQPPERFIISDITIEAVAGVLDNTPLGVLLDRDEFNALLGGMDAYRKTSTDMQSWIEIYEGEGLTVDRATKGMIHIAYPSVSMLGGIQRIILKQTIEKRPDFIHSGFGSRFLFVMPEKEPVMWKYNNPKAKFVLDYENLIDRILADRENVLEKDATGIKAFATVKPIVFTLSEEARRVLYSFQHQNARQAVYENAANAAAMNKAGRIAARLCLVLHCVRSVEETGQLGGRPVVSKETAENAVVIAGWFINEAERVYAMLAGERVDGELTDNQREVMRVLRRAGIPATVRELKRRSRILQKMENLDVVVEELRMLGKIEQQCETDVGNHGTVRYKIKRLPLTVDTSPAFAGNYASSVSVNTDNTRKNEISDAGVIEGFEEYQNPAAVSESGEQPCDASIGDPEKTPPSENENLSADTVDADTRPILSENCEPSVNGNTNNGGKNNPFPTTTAESVVGNGTAKRYLILPEPIECPIKHHREIVEILDGFGSAPRQDNTHPCQSLGDASSQEDDSHAKQCSDEKAKNSPVGTVDADISPVLSENCAPNVNGNTDNTGGDTDFSLDIIEVAGDDPELPVILKSSPSGLAKFIRCILGDDQNKRTFSFEDDIISYFDGDRVPASKFLRDYGFDVVDDKLRIVNFDQ